MGVAAISDLHFNSADECAPDVSDHNARLAALSKQVNLLENEFGDVRACFDEFRCSSANELAAFRRKHDDEVKATAMATHDIARVITDTFCDKLSSAFDLLHRLRDRCDCFDEQLQKTKKIAESVGSPTFVHLSRELKCKSDIAATNALDSRITQIEQRLDESAVTARSPIDIDAVRSDGLSEFQYLDAGVKHLERQVDYVYTWLSRIFPHHTGAKVILDGLRRVELNGAEGKLLLYDFDTERWAVQMVDKQVRIKSENLFVASSTKLASYADSPRVGDSFNSSTF